MFPIAAARLPNPLHFLTGHFPPSKAITKSRKAASSSSPSAPKYATEPQPYVYEANATVHGTGIWVSKGFEYVKSRMVGETHYLQCRYFRKKSCKGRAKLDVAKDLFYALEGDDAGAGHICQFV